MTDTFDRAEEIMSAIKTFKKLAAMAQESADGWAGRCFPALREKWLRQARRRRKAAARLTQSLGKEMERINSTITAQL